jgi:EmrB/QacA subfamily drug resistance transporter
MTAADRRALLPVIGGLMLALMLAALDNTIVSTALPTIVGELGDLGQLAFVVSSYMLAATISVPIFGRLSDLLGRKRVFMAAIVIFVSGAALSGASVSLSQLIGFRLIQGVGAGGLMAMTMTILAELVSPRERGRYAGYIGAVFGTSSIIGPVLGGLFVDHASWRLVFWVSVPLGLLALAVLQRLLRLPAPVGPPPRVDWGGAALLVVSVGAGLLALSWGGSLLPWGSPAWLATAGLAVVGLAALWVVERRVSAPIVPLALFRNRVFAVAAPLGFLTGVAMFATIVFMPMYLQAVVGMSATGSGLLLVSLLAGLVATTTLSGRAIVRWGRYRPFPIAGAALMLLGLVGLATLGDEPGLHRIGGSLLVVGLGLGMIIQIIVLAVQNAVPARDLGSATALTQFFRMLGATVGLAAAGVLLQARLAATIGADLPAGTDLAELLSSPTAIAALPGPLRTLVEGGLADGILFIYAAVVPVVLVAFVLAWLLPHQELREHA